MECLRKSGDLVGLGRALAEFKGTSHFDASRLRQLEINQLWVAVTAKDWDRVDDLAGDLDTGLLPDDQRAQVTFCRGLGLENGGHPAEALIAYNIAMTADAGASEDVARLAALRVMALHLADPEVRSAMDLWGTVEDNRTTPGFFRLKEAVAVAELFEHSLGAGSPLPAELRVFSKYRGTH
jgi:hypothetical protein